MPTLSKQPQAQILTLLTPAGTTRRAQPAAKPASEGSGKRPSGGFHFTPSLVGLPLLALLFAGVLFLLLLLSLAIGSRPIPLEHVAHILFVPTQGTEATIIWKLRFPRTLAALAAGIALSLAGILMQALSRNPLAEPGLLGVNSGASFAVVGAVAFLGISSTQNYLWFALIGAGITATLVMFLGTRRSQSQEPTTRLILSGVAFNACLGSLTGIITMFNSKAFDSHRFWVVGSLAERTYQAVGAVTPFILAGAFLAFLLIKPLSVLALGDDSAVSLGVPLPAIRLTTLLAITLLCGASTALAGPIGFVGLLVPHLLRLTMGNKLSRIVPFSLLLGPIIVLGADILGRVIAVPSEIEVGIVTAFIGAPALLLLVLRLNKRPAKKQSHKVLESPLIETSVC